MAGPNIRFTGRVTDAQAAELMASCRAFVVTSVEEFGIAAVEAQAAGRPVIARAGGGLLETVLDATTGCFWDGGEAELAEAVARFDPDAVDPRTCVDNAARFDTSVFRQALPREVEAALRERREEREGRTQAGRRAAQSRRPGSLYYARRGSR
jgi:glycosyltransferase involved in cell wall biosynthesis